MSDHAGTDARRAAAFRIGGTMAALLVGVLAVAAAVRPDMLMSVVHAVMRMAG